MKNQLRIAFITCTIIISNSANAKGVCDIALSNNAINTTDESVTSKLTFQKKEDLCRREYGSAEEFKNSARNSGFNIGYEGFELGHSGGKRTGSGKLSFSSEEFCKANQLDLYSFYTSRIKTSVADIALEAWKNCINTTQRNAFFIEYKESEESNGATGFLYRKITDGTTTFTITDMKVQPYTVNVQCYVNGEKIEKGKLNLKMDSARESFTCDKPKEKSVNIGFGTNIGDPIFIELRSASKKEQTTIDELAGRVIGLDDKVTEITRKITPIPTMQKDMDKLAKRPRVLASIRVKNGNIVSRTNGVSFNSSNGEITFPNPSNLTVIPLVSDFSETQYITETHYVRSSNGRNKVQIWETPLDTSGRNGKPDNFSVVILAQ